MPSEPVVIPASTFGAPTYTTDGPDKVRSKTRKVGKHPMSAARKRWLDSGKSQKNLTAVEEMTTGSASLTRHVKVNRSGGTRYSAGKPGKVVITSIPQL